MSKREPLLRRYDLYLEGGGTFLSEGGEYVLWEDVETMLQSGKLRVVEEVEAMCGDHGGIEGCSCSKCSAPVAPEYWMFCPGCGNKIKR